MSNDSDLFIKVRRTSEKIAENLHVIANDPSKALYRIQEHVRKVLPATIDKRTEVLRLQENIQGYCYDMEYAISAIKDLEKASVTFRNIEDLLKTSIYLKQQLKFEESRVKTRKDANQVPVYKRFSAQILDLPELSDFSGVVRETGNRVENIITGKSKSNGSELQRSYTTLH